jgi:archaellum component FlaC
MEKHSRKSDERTKDRYTVVLEQINSKIDLLVEGHQGLGQKMERLDDRIDQLDNTMERLDEKFEGFRAETESSFRTLADYLARIEAELHGELKSRVGMKEFAALQKRVEQLEENLRQTRLAGAKA